MAVTGSEIPVAATPRATPCFIDRAEILAASQHDLRALQIRPLVSHRVVGKPNRRNLRSFANNWRGFDDIQGWQGVAMTASGLPVSVPAPDFLGKSMRGAFKIAL